MQKALMILVSILGALSLWAAANCSDHCQTLYWELGAVDDN